MNPLFSDQQKENYIPPWYLYSNVQYVAIPNYAYAVLAYIISKQGVSLARLFILILALAS